MIRALESRGFDVYDSHRVMALDTESIILEQHQAIKESDVVVADVSKPSHGVGMEVILARVIGKPVLCLSKRGSRISNTLRSATGTILEYDSFKEMEELLKTFNFSKLDHSSLCPLICPLSDNHNKRMKSHKSHWTSSKNYK